MQAKEQTEQSTQAARDSVTLAVGQSMAMTASSQRSAVVVSEGERGLFARFFQDKEDKHHHAVEKIITNAAQEAILASMCISSIATSYVETGLEMERSFEQAIHAHSDSPMALAAAPALIGHGRHLYEYGGTAVTDAAIERTTRKMR